MTCQSYLDSEESDLELLIQNHEIPELASVSVTSTDKISYLSLLSLERINPLNTSFQNIVVNRKIFYW